MPNLRAIVEAYNDAWNRHDLDAIVAAHAETMVFHNHTAGERVEGAAAVRDHIARIFENSPDLRFTTRALRVGPDFVVNEWTAHATRGGERVEWDGVDVFPFDGDGKITRKDVYSSSHAPRRVAG